MDELGLNLWQLIWQIVAFGLLLFLLLRFLWKPGLKMMDERSARIKKSMEDAEQIKQQLARTEEEFEKRMAEARKESQAIIAQATQMSDRMRDEILAEARQEAQALIEKAREEITHERKQTLAEVKEQVADLSVLVAQQVIGRSLDEQAQRGLISEILTEMGEEA
jgi:F-type H+-transporting ATPase subunit b